jgi:hypothetical protein
MKPIGQTYRGHFPWKVSLGLRVDSIRRAIVVGLYLASMLCGLCRAILQPPKHPSSAGPSKKRALGVTGAERAA